MANKELVYTPAKRWKRITAFLLDAILFLFTAVTLFSIANMALQEAPFLKENNAKRLSIQNESGLYVEGNLISSYVDMSESGLSTNREKKDFLKERIDTFYVSSFSNADARKEYQTRQLEYQYNDDFLFEKNEKGLVEEKPLNPEYFVSFYKEEVSNHCLSYLYTSSEYAQTTITSLITMIVEFAICLLLSSFLFYLVFPLWVFKRGHQTLGRKAFKISLLSVKAVNVKTGSYVGRYFFILFVYIFLGFFSFLLPEFVSLGMLLFSSRHQDLVDYVFNHYEVDSSNQEVYLDLADYHLHMQEREKATLENKDLDLTNSRKGDSF